MDDLEQKTERILQVLADIRPSTESANRMRKTVRAQIADRCRSGEQSFLQRHKRPVWSLAAAVLIIAGLWVLFRPDPPVSSPDRPISKGPVKLSPISLGSLNAAFEKGGMEAVEKVFREFTRFKKPAPEIKSVEDAVNG